VLHGDRWLVGRLFRHAITNGDDRTIGDREDLGAEGEVLLIPRAIARIRTAVLQPQPIDGERLELDIAFAVDREPSGTMRRIRYATAVGIEPAGAAQRRGDDQRRAGVHGQLGAGDGAAVEEGERGRICGKLVGDLVTDPRQRLTRR
jgi:hypothetical protein